MPRSRSRTTHRRAGWRWAAIAATLAAGAVVPSLAAAQVRITEVLVNPFGADAGLQVVEIENAGSGAVSVAGWRLVSATDVATLPGGISLASGQRYLIHLSADGANDASNYFTGAGFDPVSASAHSLALYAAAGALTDPAAMRAFVQWGGAGQAREAVAVQAGLWSQGDFIPITSEGNSMQLCGASSGTSGAWLETTPTLGDSNNCPLGSEVSTWGRVKSFYR